MRKKLGTVQWYEDSTFVLIGGKDTGHGFGYMLNRPAQICADSVIDFIERTSIEE